MLRFDLNYQQGGFKLQLQLEMQQEILGIVGASGAGKSSLLKLLLGLLCPQQGYIELDQTRLFDSQLVINIPMHRRKIAMVFQQAWLFPHLNVRQNLCYAQKFLKPAQSKFHLDEVVDLLELQPLIQRKAHQLSGGEAQRISIGRALLSSPHLLLLDEPLTGLDQDLKQQLLPYLARIQTEMRLPMIYVTHHREELEFLAARVMQLQAGKWH
ncbi:molybdate transport system ATP-binding protein [Acinetobacter calcoaceticus]|uniref:Molybdate transport system ATP-binding protein n=1 Tax=Acinetobacter calcoaceticus TaxID=471 RepID=A0A4R1Y0Q3_ACICA|nr:molybdate transport system ATP-binding protein [Acinetobacter calcoaceticus]